MKRSFYVSLALIFIGNLLITILEKQLYSSNDIETLQQNLFNAKSNADVTAIYPSRLLFTKMSIWIFSFSIVTVILHFVKLSKKIATRNIVIAFYTIGCLINAVSVPHPIWFIISIIPIVIVPFIIVENLLTEIEKIFAISKKSISTKESFKINSKINLG